MADDIQERDGYFLFWSGWPSQWHPATFEIEGVTYSCAEQFMMAEKARLFGDTATLAKILAAKTPKQQKALGRKVTPFDADRWTAACRDIVVRGNLAKFSQNSGLQKKLLATGDLVLVEASPLDRIWGIGLKASDPRATKPEEWRGTNWLGEALMTVRTQLRAAGTQG